MKNSSRTAWPIIRPVAALILVLLAWQNVPTSEAKTLSPALADTTHAAQAFEETWGVEILGIRLSAAGTMLDFRFRVVDPEKARPLVARNAEAYMVAEKSGKKLAVPNPPKVGKLRQTAMEAKTGTTYFAMFGNPGRLVASGDQVTVVIGDFRAEHLVVDAS